MATLQRLSLKVTFCHWTMTAGLLGESVLRQQDEPAGDLAELKYPPYPGGILL